MKKVILNLILVSAIAGCGGDTTSFPGNWSGSFTSLTNTCPFSVNEDINPIFPVNVSVDENDVFTVIAVTGEKAVGGQGSGESISFLAKSSKFGNYGSIAPYSCKEILSEFGLLTAGNNQAKATLTIKFNECSTPNSTKVITCGATYFGDAVRSNS